MTLTASQPIAGIYTSDGRPWTPQKTPAASAPISRGLPTAREANRDAAQRWFEILTGTRPAWPGASPSLSTWDRAVKLVVFTAELQASNDPVLVDLAAKVQEAAVDAVLASGRDKNALVAAVAAYFRGVQAQKQALLAPQRRKCPVGPPEAGESPRNGLVAFAE